MQVRTLRLFSLLLIITIPGVAQEKSRKELREEESQRKMAETEKILNSGEFVFVAQWAYPVGGNQIDLRSNPNYVKFNPELLDGYMPFFGNGYTGLGFSGEIGIKFKDKPTDYKISRTKKYFLVETRVKGINDVFRLLLTVTGEGRSDLSITSNNRSSIRYSGAIMSPESHGR